ncbi:urease subunit alpha, partial [Klebsiella pneumoniae]
QAGLAERLGLRKRVSIVQGCCTVTKKHMVHNDAMPHLEVDPETYEVRCDGVLLSCLPAAELPLTQRYFLF